MDVVKINLAKAKEIVDQAIEEYGEDYVYPYVSCAYYHPANSCEYLNFATIQARGVGVSGENTVETIPETVWGCGVGVAMSKLGFTMEDMETVRASDVRALFRHLRGLGKLEYTEAALRWLTEFQSAQDNSMSWGKARITADREYANVEGIYSDTEYN